MLLEAPEPARPTTPARARANNFYLHAHHLVRLVVFLQSPLARILCAVASERGPPSDSNRQHLLFTPRRAIEGLPQNRSSTTPAAGSARRRQHRSAAAQHRLRRAGSAAAALESNRWHCFEWNFNAMDSFWMKIYAFIGKWLCFVFFSYLLLFLLLFAARLMISFPRTVFRCHTFGYAS